MNIIRCYGTNDKRMSALMRNWIGPAVCKQLQIALQGKGHNGKDLVSYDQDGTLRIRITEGKPIQLNEVRRSAFSPNCANRLAVH